MRLGESVCDTKSLGIGYAEHHRGLSGGLNVDYKEDYDVQSWQDEGI